MIGFFLTVLSFPNTIPSEKQFELSARNLGINKDSAIIIYDNKGVKVTTLVDSNLKKGKYEYVWTPNNLPSGFYYYTLKIGNKMSSNKLVLIK